MSQKHKIWVGLQGDETWYNFSKNCDQKNVFFCIVHKPSNCGIT